MVHIVIVYQLVWQKKQFGVSWLRKLWDFFREDPCNSKDSRSDMSGEDRGEQIADAGGHCESGCLEYYPAYDDVWGPIKK
jgi:hypothetical protein